MSKEISLNVIPYCPPNMGSGNLPAKISSSPISIYFVSEFIDISPLSFFAETILYPYILTPNGTSISFTGWYEYVFST